MATDGDVDGLAQLYRQYRDELPGGEDAPPPSLPACRRRVVRAMRRSNGAALVITDGDMILGFCLLRIVVDSGMPGDGLLRRITAEIRTSVVRRLLGRAAPPGARRIAFMDDIYVVPEARARGVALPLFRNAFAWGRAQGVTVMEGATAADNAAMLRLAEHFDMRVVRVLLRKGL